MWYWILRAFTVLALRIFFRLRVEGLGNLPRKTNFIVVANHVSFLDPLAVEAAVPQKIHCLAKKSLYSVFGLRLYLKLKEAIPTGDSSKKTIALLKENKVVGLFPEGARSHDGKLNKFRRGVALLALKTGRPIVPCVIFGTYDAFPPGAKFPKFLPIKVKIGKPVYLLKHHKDVIDDMHLQEGIHRVRNTIKELMMYA
jgi:1-acyl-sn-glycerol-3-phosphate acyltransferase